MELDPIQFSCIAVCLQGFCYGLYTGIFILCLQYRNHGKNANRGNNVVFYALCLLYGLSVVTIVLDLIILFFPQNLSPSRLLSIFYPLNVSTATTFAFCDFVAQFILIHRCWIVWGYNTRVVIMPSMLAFAFLGIWIAGGAAPMYLSPDQQLSAPSWGFTLAVVGIAVSMAVNALVTGLIVFRIFQVFRLVRHERMFGVNGRGNVLRSTIFMLIESGGVLFIIQLIRLVDIALVVWTGSVAAANAYPLISSVHEVSNGITPTIILLRVSMGFSFHDEDTMVEATESLCFASTTVASSL